ncbi:MAG: DUF2335 domain-containing protein [Bacteroidota bacterium]
MSRRQLTVKNTKAARTQSTNSSTDNSAELSHMEISELENPFPEAEELQKFIPFLPDAPNRFFKYVEKEQQFRHDAYNKRLSTVSSAQNAENFTKKAGMIFGFILFMFALLISGFLLYSDKNVTGSIFMGATLLLGVGMFVKKEKPDP